VEACCFSVAKPGGGSILNVVDEAELNQIIPESPSTRAARPTPAEPCSRAQALGKGART
jgi:hypothetical protein